jgi:hypothetical protein
MSYKSTKITKQSHPKEWALLKKTCLNYKKRSALLIETESTELTGRYWSDGSIDRYSIWNPAGQMTVVPNRQDYPFTAPDTEVDLMDGTVVVQCGVFCGKPGTAFLYMKPAEVVIGEDNLQMAGK